MSIHDNVFDLLSEATKPTSPVLSWNARIYINDLLPDWEVELTPEKINALGKQIAEKLEACPLWAGEQADYITSNFQHVWDQDKFNRILNEMYDECDFVRILVC